MSDESETRTSGTARPAKLEKAGCGIRYREDELREGVDFSGAAALKPDDNEEPDGSPPVSPD